VGLGLAGTLALPARGTSPMTKDEGAPGTDVRRARDRAPYLRERREGKRNYRV